MRYLLGEEITEVTGFYATMHKTNHKNQLIATDDNAYLTCKTASGVLGSIIVTWTNYGEPEANYTCIYGSKGVMMISADPVWSVIVRRPGGEEQRFKIGQMSTNEKQVSSGVSDAFTASILKGQKPAIDGLEGYKSLNVILTAMDAAAQKKSLKIKSL
jgi:predicted dehydrogenase